MLQEKLKFDDRQTQTKRPKIVCSQSLHLRTQTCFQSNVMTMCRIKLLTDRLMYKQIGHIEPWHNSFCSIMYKKQIKLQGHNVNKHPHLTTGKMNNYCTTLNNLDEQRKVTVYTLKSHWWNKYTIIPWFKMFQEKYNQSVPDRHNDMAISCW